MFKQATPGHSLATGLFVLLNINKLVNTEKPRNVLEVSVENPALLREHVLEVGAGGGPPHLHRLHRLPRGLHPAQ